LFNTNTNTSEEKKEKQPIGASDNVGLQASVVRNATLTLGTTIGGATPPPKFPTRTLPPPAWGRVPNTS
jgi:hypothetical protein